MKKKTIVFSLILLLGVALIPPSLAQGKLRGWYEYSNCNVQVNAHDYETRDHEYHGGSISGGAYITSVNPSYASNYSFSSYYCPEEFGGVVHVEVENYEDYQIVVYYTVWFYCN